MKNLLKKPLPLPSWLHNPLRVLFVIFLVISLPILAIFLFVKIYEFTTNHWPIPDYQKQGVANYSEICEKIQNKSWRQLCFSKTQDDNFQIDLSSLKPGYETTGCGGWYGEKLKEILSESENKSLKCKEMGPNKAPQNYCLSLITNPYYCKRINAIDVFFDRWIKDYCYLDAALIWEDPFLCDKVKNIQDRDFCYLRVIQNK